MHNSFSYIINIYLYLKIKHQVHSPKKKKKKTPSTQVCTGELIKYINYINQVNQELKIRISLQS